MILSIISLAFSAFTCGYIISVYNHLKNLKK